MSRRWRSCSIVLVLHTFQAVTFDAESQLEECALYMPGLPLLGLLQAFAGALEIGLSQRASVRIQVYVVYFKTNRNFIHQFPNMSDYVKDLYSNPGACSAGCHRP